MASPSAVHQLDDSLGAALIGVVVMLTLFGILIAQTHAYYRAFEEDPTWIKVLVGAVFILEIAQSICATHVLYHFSVTGYGNPLTLVHPPKTFGVNTLITTILKLTIEGYFSFRIWKLTKRKDVSLVAIGMNITAAGFGLLVAVNAITLESLPQFTLKMSWAVPTTLAVSLALDIFITATLITWLTSRRHMALQSTVKVLDSVLAWSIQTGLITTLNSTILLATYLTMRHNFIWVAFYVILPKLFSNSLLASLNGRLDLRGYQSDVVPLDTLSVGGVYSSAAMTSSSGTRSTDRSFRFPSRGAGGPGHFEGIKIDVLTFQHGKHNSSDTRTVTYAV